MNVRTGASSKRKQMNILKGSIWDKILLFAIPIALTNILQQLFTTADTAVVGRLVGNHALAAVGCAGPVVTLFITIFSGLAVGANAIIARMIGLGHKDQIKKSVHSSIVIALIAGLIITVIGEAIAVPLLKSVGTPEDVMDMAVRYLRIYFSGSIFLTLYNFESAIFRANGDTKKPLYILVISGIVNIFLNLFFVIVFHMSVAGVALATLASNAVSAVALFWLLMREDGALKISFSDIRLSPDIAKNILVIGVPSAVQGMIFNIANIIIQSGINSLGSVAVAGATVGQNIEIFGYFAVTGFGQAAVTFNSQNLGAGNIKRCIASTRWCIALGFIFTALVSVLLVAFRFQLSALFTSDRAVIEIAAERIFLIAAFEVINMVIEVMSGALRGLGRSLSPALLSVFCICGVRMIWLFLIFPMNRTFGWLFTVYPISWIIAMTAITIAYLITKRSLLSEQAVQEAI